MKQLDETKSMQSEKFYLNVNGNFLEVYKRIQRILGTGERRDNTCSIS